MPYSLLCFTLTSCLSSLSLLRADIDFKKRVYYVVDIFFWDAQLSSLHIGATQKDHSYPSVVNCVLFGVLVLHTLGLGAFSGSSPDNPCCQQKKRGMAVGCAGLCVGTWCVRCDQEEFLSLGSGKLSQAEYKSFNCGDLCRNGISDGNQNCCAEWNAE